MNDDQIWKTRFHQLMLVRLIGLAVFALGIAIMSTDLLRPGGWPQVGAILAILGALGSLLAPRLLKKVWERQ
ncbi:hypothetical protein G7077_05785 [Sphingomonas piscis]|uniref:Uncharacterized protein n=1 Tax=Sphingomonas piscis TaxID=2714943 RepID=A0A6G7YP14_9SPHN|nr:hypothetical protein [Sphingomonas piscis]QIK78485.1 hypothetical protein G7077_05785 [Sphingomonas piscis]